MPQRPYVDTPSNITGPACGVFAVTPSDSADLTAVTRGLYVGVSGDVVVVPAYGDGTAVTFKTVPAGMILPVMAIRVKATGTTATNILAMY